MASPEVAHRKVIAERLLELIQHPAWDTYKDVLAQYEEGYIQRCIKGSRDEFDYYKGLIEGLRIAYHLPAKLQGEFLPVEKT